MAADGVVLAVIKQLLATVPAAEQAEMLQRLLAEAVQQAEAVSGEAVQQVEAVSGEAVQQAEAVANYGSGRDDRISKLLDQPHSDITYKIIGCAMTAHRQLGCGLRESSYQHALEHQMALAGLAYAPQQQIAVYDSLHGRRLLGYYIPDFVVENAVVVEIKALGRLENAHVAQVISYLAVTDCRVGLLVNFGQRALKWCRILPPHDLQAYEVNKQWLWNPFVKPAPEP